MKNSVKKKVNGIGLAGKIISIVMIVLMAIACSGLLTAGIIFAVMPKDSIRIGVDADVSVEVSDRLLGLIGEDLAEGAIDGINNRKRADDEPFELTAEKTDSGLLVKADADSRSFFMKGLIVPVITGFIFCAALLVVFVFLRRLCDSFRTCDSPFDAEVIKRMKVFAWVLVGAAALMSAAGSVGRTVGSLFKLGGSFSLDFSLNLWPVFIALVVLFLTVIFRYGAELQKESDETL